VDRARSTGTTVRCSTTPPRSSARVVARPIRSALSSRISASAPSTGTPSTDSTRSPASTPAWAAGPPGSTSLTRIARAPAPVASARRRGSGTVSAAMPIWARRTRPWAMNSDTANTAVLDATAKQMPWARLIMAVLMPTTSPALETSGPPELPGLSAASVWITSSISRPPTERSERPSADTTPAVTVDSKPSGLPIAITSWPRRSRALSPSTADGVPAGSGVLKSARSVSGSLPSTRASAWLPSGNDSRTRAALPTTCELVSTSPSLAMTTPDPVPPPGSLPSASRSTRTTAGPTRSTTETTARE
jgi:hypothetical protein